MMPRSEVQMEDKIIDIGKFSEMLNPDRRPATAEMGHVELFWPSESGLGQWRAKVDHLVADGSTPSEAIENLYLVVCVAVKRTAEESDRRTRALRASLPKEAAAG